MLILEQGSKRSFYFAGIISHLFNENSIATGGVIKSTKV
jgi:hypothetical protein